MKFRTTKERLFSALNETNKIIPIRTTLPILSCVLIEAKASGMPLTQELRSMGIPVQNYSPSRGNDKFTRVNSVAPMFQITF